MPCHYRCQLVAWARPLLADLALALLWLLILPSWGKVWLFGPQKGRQLSAATSTAWKWMSRSGHGRGLAGAMAVILQVGIFWDLSGSALVLGIWHQGNSLGMLLKTEALSCGAGCRAVMVL